MDVKIRNIIVTVVFVVGLLCAWLFSSGCAVKLFPIRNTDAQVEMLRRIAIDSYKQGMFETLEAWEESEEYEDNQDVLPWSEEFEMIPHANPEEKKWKM